MASLSDQILSIMKDHNWHTLAELVVKTGGKSPSVAARMRYLRTPEKGGHTIERRMHNGAYEYRIAGKSAPVVETPAAPSKSAIHNPKQKTRKTPVLSSDGLTVGQIIRGRRTQLFMTQKQLAEKVGAGPMAVYNWERLNYTPTKRFLPALAAALGISEEQILSGKRNERKRTGPKPKPKTEPVNVNIAALATAIAEALLKAQGR